MRLGRCLLRPAPSYALGAALIVIGPIVVSFVRPRRRAMMAGRSMRGSWAGVYAYDPSPAIPDDLPPFGFTLDIDEECEGKFRGAVRDDYLAGVAEPGRVQGRVVGD